MSELLWQKFALSMCLKCVFLIIWKVCSLMMVLGGVPDGFAFSLHMARQPIDDIVKVDDWMFQNSIC